MSPCLRIITLSLLAAGSFAQKHQVGDKTERFEIELKKFDSYGYLEQKLILATVKILNENKKSMGTGFAFKKSDSEIYFLTNNHVLANQRECDDATVSFLNADRSVSFAKCKKVVKSVGKDGQMDYTVFTLHEEKRILSIFDDRLFEIETSLPTIGDELITAGFGHRSFNKRKFDITLSNDHDCKVLDGIKTIVMKDYPMANTVTVGCDAASGDSGSAIVSKTSEKIVALFFGTATVNKKNPRLTSKEIEENIFNKSFMRFWTAGSWATAISRIEFKLD